jgi:hypothetical protein
MDSNKIIDLLGGTNAVADLCKVTKGAVSQWRKDGIPSARRMYLLLLRPDVFGPTPACESKQAKQVEAA